MILKGNQRAGGRALAAHLSNGRDNDHVELHELRGFASSDMLGAFLEIEAAAAGTRCQQPFFSVSINPPAGQAVALDQFELAAAAIEAKFPGLADRPRAIVFHEKDGRRHAHAIWSRIDTDRGRAVALPHSRMKLRDVSRDMYLALGIEPPAGIKDRARADPLNYDRATWQQAKRLDEDPRDLKRIIREAWALSDNRTSFENALERHALTLARGDRRGYVIVHHTGEPISLTRFAGLKTKEITARLGGPERLPTLDQVKGVLRARMTQAVQQRQAAVRAKHAQQMQPLRTRAAAMKQAHRAERQTVQGQQAARQQREELARANRLRKGIMGLWDRLSGKRGKVSEFNRQEAAAGRMRDRDERQKVTDRQIGERRALQAELVRLRDQQKAERDFARAEMAVMFSMQKDSTRDQFRDHAEGLDRKPAQDKGRDDAPGRDFHGDQFDR